jgi:tetratricopeptide (TPR) repeat protein
MKLLRVAPVAALVTSLALLPFVLFCSGCERQDDGPDGATPATPFTLPQADVSSLSAGLQDKVQTLRGSVTQSPEDPTLVGELGAIYLIHGFPGAAADCFAHAASLSPRETRWWYYTGLARDQAGQGDQAIAAYEQALELDANYGPLYVRIARLLVESDRERAVRLCERALELNAQDVTAIFTLGLCDEAAGDNATALTRFQGALQSVPNYKEAHQAMARLLSASGDAEEAARHVKAAANSLTPRVDDHLYELLLRRGFDLDTLLRDAMTMAERRLFEEAEEPLARARIVDANGAATHRATGFVRAAEDRLEEAAQELRAALEIEPDSLATRARLGDVLARLQQFPEAEAELRAVLEQDPDDPFTLDHLSRILVTLERADEAEQLLRDAAERRPEAPWVRLQLGILLYTTNKDDQARQQLLKCLELSPDEVRASFFLGWLARRAGDTAEALRRWEEVVEKLPTFRDAHMALAQTAMQQRDFAAAERYLRNGLKQDPDVAGLANGLAWILATSPVESQRNGEEALRLAEKACKLTNHEQHTYIDTLATAYAELGRFDEAVKAAQDAVALAQKANDEQSIAEYQERLKLYEQNTPYRDVE